MATTSARKSASEASRNAASIRLRRTASSGFAITGYWDRRGRRRSWHRRERRWLCLNLIRWWWSRWQTSCNTSSVGHGRAASGAARGSSYRPKGSRRCGCVGRCRRGRREFDAERCTVGFARWRLRSLGEGLGWRMAGARFEAAQDVFPLQVGLLCAGRSPGSRPRRCTPSCRRPCQTIDPAPPKLTIPIATVFTAVQSNKVYPPPCAAPAAIDVCGAADKRYSLGHLTANKEAITHMKRTSTGQFKPVPLGEKTQAMLKVEAKLGRTLEEDFREFHIEKGWGQKRIAQRWDTQRATIFAKNKRGSRRSWVQMLNLPVRPDSEADVEKLQALV